MSLRTREDARRRMRISVRVCLYIYIYTSWTPVKYGFLAIFWKLLTYFVVAILVMQERWQIFDVKPGTAGLVLGWVTKWEYPASIIFFFSFLCLILRLNLFFPLSWLFSFGLLTSLSLRCAPSAATLLLGPGLRGREPSIKPAPFFFKY